MRCGWGGTSHPLPFRPYTAPASGVILMKCQKPLRVLPHVRPPKLRHLTGPGARVGAKPPRTQPPDCYPCDRRGSRPLGFSGVAFGITFHSPLAKFPLPKLRLGLLARKGDPVEWVADADEGLLPGGPARETTPAGQQPDQSVAAALPSVPRPPARPILRASASVIRPPSLFREPLVQAHEHGTPSGSPWKTAGLPLHLQPIGREGALGVYAPRRRAWQGRRSARPHAGSLALAADRPCSRHLSGEAARRRRAAVALVLEGVERGEACASSLRLSPRSAPNSRTRASHFGRPCQFLQACARLPICRSGAR